MRKIAGFALALISSAAFARSPFDVGISEGGNNASGLFGWILAKQMAFEQGLTAAVHGVAASPSAAWALAGLSFAYGVFHAAGPGHGKAVVASYLIANEQALKRGLVLSFLAALLQGVVAIVLVAVLALIINATAQTMQNTAHVVELLSFAGIAALGAWLVWRKGGAFWRALRGDAARDHHLHGHDDHHHGHAHGANDHHHEHAAHDHFAHGTPHVHDEHCGHFHAPDPKTLGAQFSWRAALTTVVVAGARPCSGAILVLVFALSQGIFWAGIVATLAMSLGTAITTGALAAVAVLFKGLAVRFAGAESGRAVLMVRGLEFLAACAVLVTGLGLFFGFAASGL